MQIYYRVNLLCFTKGIRAISTLKSDNPKAMSDSINHYVNHNQAGVAL